MERHGKTLLPQYLGMYRLTVDGEEYYLVAMRNVFSNHLNVHRYINNNYSYKFNVISSWEINY